MGKDDRDDKKAGKKNDKKGGAKDSKTDGKKDSASPIPSSSQKVNTSKEVLEMIPNLFAVQQVVQGNMDSRLKQILRGAKEHCGDSDYEITIEQKYSACLITGANEQRTRRYERNEATNRTLPEIATGNKQIENPSLTLEMQHQIALEQMKQATTSLQTKKRKEELEVFQRRLELQRQQETGSKPGSSWVNLDFNALRKVEQLEQLARQSGAQGRTQQNSSSMLSNSQIRKMESESRSIGQELQAQAIRDLQELEAKQSLIEEAQRRQEETLQELHQEAMQLRALTKSERKKLSSEEKKLQRAAKLANADSTAEAQKQMEELEDMEAKLERQRAIAKGASDQKKRHLASFYREAIRSGPSDLLVSSRELVKARSRVLTQLAGSTAFAPSSLPSSYFKISKVHQPSQASLVKGFSAPVPDSLLMSSSAANSSQKYQESRKPEAEKGYSNKTRKGNKTKKSSSSLGWPWL